MHPLLCTQRLFQHAWTGLFYHEVQGSETTHESFLLAMLEVGWEDGIHSLGIDGHIPPL